MGGLGLLLVPALGGYLFLIRFNGTRDRIGRQSGYHVVLKAAVAGVVLFAVARFGVMFLNEWMSSPEGGDIALQARRVTALWKDAIDLEYSGTAALSVLLGWLSPFVANLFVNRLRVRRRIARDVGDHIGLVVDAALRRSFIEVTLASGKVYVGVPLARTFVARAEGGDLVLLPAFSGYRHKDTHEVKLTVNYAPVLREKRRGRKLDVRSFRIALCMAEVMTARPFDRHSYREFAAIRRETSIDDVAA